MVYFFGCEFNFGGTNLNRFAICHLQTSSGDVEFRQNDGQREETVIQTILKVNNCINLNVTAQIYGMGASVATQLFKHPYVAEIAGDKLFEPKSFAFIYAHNETRSMNRFLTIGQRQFNDTLLKFATQSVTNDVNIFPEYEFEYSDPMAFITQVEFKFNVSFMELHNFFFFSLFSFVPELQIFSTIPHVDGFTESEFAEEMQ